MEVVIVAKARFHADPLLARLLMVYFPWMEIEDCRALLEMIQPPQKPAGDRVRP
jgi:hypothetical protein